MSPSPAAETPRPYLSALLVAWLGVFIFELGIAYFLDTVGVTLFITLSLILVYTVMIGVVSGRLHLRILEVLPDYRLFLGFLFAYLGLTWLGCIWTSEPGYAIVFTLQQTWYVVLGGVALVALGNIPPARRLRVVALGGALGLAGLMFFATSPLYLGTMFVSRHMNEAGQVKLSPFNDYTVFVHSCMLAISCAAIWWDYRKPRVLNVRPTWPQLLTYLGLVLLAGLMGVLSGARSAILIHTPLALLCPFLILSSVAMRRAAVAFMLVAVPLASVGLWVITDHTAIDRINSLFPADIQLATERGLGFLLPGGYADTQGRTERWRWAYEVTTDYGPVGALVGGGTKDFLSDSRFVRPDGGRDSPHNFFMSALVDGGVLKALVLIGMVVTWGLHVVQALRLGFWTASFFLLGILEWLAATSISGVDFFSHRHIYMFFFLHMAILDAVRRIRAPAPLAGAPTAVRTALVPAPPGLLRGAKTGSAR